MTTPGFDPALKDMVEGGPDDWPILSGLPAGPTRLVDADIATVSGAADKVLLVEADPPYMLHLEFLIGHDAAAQPLKLHQRNILLEDRHQLDVKTVTVLFREEDDSQVLDGVRQRTFRGEAQPYTLFRYDVLRIWQVPPKILLAGGPGILPLAPLGAVTRAQLPGIIEEMGQRLRSRRLAAAASRLWAITLILMGVRYPKELAQQLLRGVLSMREYSSTYQAIASEVQGEATLAEARRILLMLGETAFGPPDAATRSAIDQINDVATLETLLLRIMKASGWKELLGPARTRRRNNRRPHR